jgi:hypothetical protein
MSDDRNRLAAFVDDLERSLGRLEQLSQMPVDDFLDDEDAQDIARSRDHSR